MSCRRRTCPVSTGHVLSPEHVSCLDRACPAGTGRVLWGQETPHIKDGPLGITESVPVYILLSFCLRKEMPDTRKEMPDTRREMPDTRKEKPDTRKENT